jgi:hypothetical protein
MVQSDFYGVFQKGRLAIGDLHGVIYYEASREINPICGLWSGFVFLSPTMKKIE